MNQISDEENIIYEIYKITNIANNLIYIGVAKKWVKLAKKKYYLYGAKGRYKRHISNAFSENEKCANDCPEFYKAIREFGADNFEVEVIKTINDNVKKYEEEEIIKYKSHDPEYGYNILLSVKKPLTKKDNSKADKIVYMVNKHGHKIDPPQPIKHESFNANPGNDWTFTDRMRKEI